MLKLNSISNPSWLKRISSWLDGEPDPPDYHVPHMRRVAVIWGVIMFFIFLVNRQVLRETVLVNSPSYDALVYQNWSYGDYYLLRSAGIGRVLYEHLYNNNLPTPPLHILSGMFSYVLLGLDPANFYIAPAVWFFMLGLGVYGFIYYWSRRKIWAVFGMILVLSLPSMVSFGLRVSQTDFSVGAAFSWCTYVLAASDGFKSRKGSIVYGISTSLCLLLKASIAPYFLAHAVIWAIYLVRGKEDRRVRLFNSLLMTLIVAIGVGWYYVPSFSRILNYYATWGTSAGASRSGSTVNTLWAEASFYANAFLVFHIKLQQNVNLYLDTLVVLAILVTAVLIGRMIVARYRTGGADAPEREQPLSSAPAIGLGIVFSVIWLVIPYTTLSIYTSKAYSVDFPFVAAYLIIPVLIVAAVFKRRWSVVGVVLLMPLLLTLGSNQIQNLYSSEPTLNWREAEIFGDILHDADTRNLNEIHVGSAFVHPFLTSENFRFYVLDGQFGQYRDRFHEVLEGYYSDPQSFFAIFQDANYVLAKTGGYVPPTHPNNVLAPQVNDLLANSPDFIELKRYHLPDGSDLIVYFNTNKPSVTYDQPLSDGWVSPRYPIRVLSGQKVQALVLEIGGSIPLPGQVQYPVLVTLQDANGKVIAGPRKVENGNPFVIRFRIPASQFISGQLSTFYVVTDKPYNPAALGISNDDRDLMLRLSTVSIYKQAPS